MNLEQHTKAREHSEQAKGIYQRSDDQAREALVLESLGQIYYGLGQYPKAIESWSRVQELLKNVNGLGRFATGVVQRTSNIAAVIQEVVNRSGWASGNSLVVIISGTGSQKRTAVSFDMNSAAAPLLHVEFSN